MENILEQIKGGKCLILVLNIIKSNEMEKNNSVAFSLTKFCKLFATKMKIFSWRYFPVWFQKIPTIIIVKGNM